MASDGYPKDLRFAEPHSADDNAFVTSRCSLCGAISKFTDGCVISSCPLRMHRALADRDTAFKIKPPLPYSETGRFDQPLGDKLPTLDTAPHDLAHAPEVPHHRFSAFHESGDYAYARGLEINPTHLPTALDAMAKSGWHLVSIFGQTDSQHIGAIFQRYEEQPQSDHVRKLSRDLQTVSQALTLALEDRDKAQARSQELLEANTVLVLARRELVESLEERRVELTNQQCLIETYVQTIGRMRDDLDATRAIYRELLVARGGE